MTEAWVHPHYPKLLAGDACCISVKFSGEKIRHHATVIMRNVRFHFHEKGAERARKAKQRGVHAWAIGEVVSALDEPVPPPEGMLVEMGLRKVSYHYDVGYFFDVNSMERVDATQYLYAVGSKFYYLPE